MEIRTIPIPGGKTSNLSAPKVCMIGEIDGMVDLQLSFQLMVLPAGWQQSPELPLARYGEIVFKSVLEYRFFLCDYEYDDVKYQYPESRPGAGAPCTLEELTDSPYVSRLISLSDKRAGVSWSGTGPHDSRIKHYRISWDEFGSFEIVALSVETREYHAPAE